jgi:hypothetical protein
MTDETTVVNGNTTTQETFVSAWFLSSIELLSGNFISFYYESITTKSPRVYSSGTTNEYVSVSPSWVYCCIPPSTFQTTYSSTSTTINTDEVVLKNIFFDNGYIDLITSARSDLKVVSGFPPVKN